MKRKINGLSTALNKGPAVFKHEQIQEALFQIQDTFERCLMPFILLEGIAKQLYEGEQFELKEITLGVKENEWSEQGRGIFRMLRPEADINPDCASLVLNGVPISICIIHRNYKFFQNLDFKWYMATEFYIPNPFPLYWKSRFLIK
jgi:hypothetical protein